MRESDWFRSYQCWYFTIPYGYLYYRGILFPTHCPSLYAWPLTKGRYRNGLHPKQPFQYAGSCATSGKQVSIGGREDVSDPALDRPMGLSVPHHREACTGGAVLYILQFAVGWSAGAIVYSPHLDFGGNSLPINSRPLSPHFPLFCPP